MTLTQESSERTWRGITSLSPSTRQFVHQQLQDLPMDRRFQGALCWMLSLLAIVTLWIWNWQLFLATGIGISVMVLVYLAHDWNWQAPLFMLRQFLNGPHRQLILAVSSGCLATLTAYIAASVWTNSQSGWVAAGAILQGLVTIGILFLLLWNLLQHQVNSDRKLFTCLLADLTAVDPLKRLIAVRQLSHLAIDPACQPNDRVTITDSFRLLLERESEVVVQDAVWEGLQGVGDRCKLYPRFADRSPDRRQKTVSSSKRSRRRSPALSYRHCPED